MCRKLTLKYFLILIKNITGKVKILFILLSNTLKKKKLKKLISVQYFFVDKSHFFFAFSTLKMMEADSNLKNDV